MEKRVEAIFLLRTIACLSVVLIHTIDIIIMDLYTSLDLIGFSLRAVQLLLMFATPAFIFMSEFVTSYQYGSTTPPHFLKKRLTFIFIPFVVMAMMYGILEGMDGGATGVLVQIAKNVFLADFHGYFILIIFQFYLLHMIFGKIEKKVTPKKMIIGSFVFNALYLAFFNLVPYPAGSVFWETVWYRVSWLPFFGWVFYFVMGYYAGRYFPAFKQLILKNRIKLLIGLVATSMAIMALRYLAIDAVSSKRFDVLFLTVIVIMLVFWASFQLKRTPKIVLLLSQYSFGIYLLHPLFQKNIFTDVVLKHVTISNPIVLTVLLFLSGIIFPIAVTYLLNKVSFGKYIVGQVKTSKKPKSAAVPVDEPKRA